MGRQCMSVVQSRWWKMDWCACWCEYLFSDVEIGTHSPRLSRNGKAGIVLQRYLSTQHTLASVYTGLSYAIHVGEWLDWEEDLDVGAGIGRMKSQIYGGKRQLQVLHFPAFSNISCIDEGSSSSVPGSPRSPRRTLSPAQIPQNKYYNPLFRHLKIGSQTPLDILMVSLITITPKFLLTKCNICL